MINHSAGIMNRLVVNGHARLYVINLVYIPYSTSRVLAMGAKATL